MINTKRLIRTTFILVALLVLTKIAPVKAESLIELPDLTGGDSPSAYVSNIRLMLLLTVLTLLPSFIIMMTSFTRIIVTFSFLKGAIGVQQSIPNQIFIGLALFLTIFIMAPVYNEINTEALVPFMNEEINQQEAMERASAPIRRFMLTQTRDKDLELFVELSEVSEEELTMENIPLHIVVPAFIISELKTAFQIGFLLYIPFLIIDLVVASVLMSMGMFMLQPTIISLPFKLLLFVMVDGWNIMVESIIKSFF
ncbi:flagellar type III secretion system pore protein FliP [Alloiococcus sp. CFN-8]|uniref:flagellar type III secretion system pore protein FliP n=1 Tax=Alloiococcus sp. CFN-8 TaxID=3416081 RepID=UPI003CF1063E